MRRIREPTKPSGLIADLKGSDPSMLSKPLIRYVLLAAVRDKLVLTLGLMIGLGAAMGVFLGSASVTEQESFSMVFGAGGLRFLGVVGIVLFGCFYMRRAFETKEVEFLLARPISRMQFLFSHAAAYIIFAFCVALAVTLAVVLPGKPVFSGLVAWSASIAAEYAIMAIAALFFSTVLSSAAGSALAALGLYVLSRLIGTLIGITKVPPDNIVFAVLNNVMELISIFVPRLDLMGQTSWLVYGVEGSSAMGFVQGAGAYAKMLVGYLGATGFVAWQGLFFCGLLLAACAYDFSRRQF